MSATPSIPSPPPPTRVHRAPEAIAGVRAGKAFLGLASAFLAFSLSGCAPSFCGAPCEAGASPAARPVLPPENHFGTRFGHLDTWNMSPAQLHAERAELESLLGADAGDAALLKVLRDRKGGAEGWIYDGFHAGGSRFRANGKLRREVGIEDIAKRIMIDIDESPRRDLFERYRLVRMQLLTLPDAPSTAENGATPESVVPPVGEGGISEPAGGGAETESTGMPAPDADALIPEAEGPWSGFFRANSGASTAAPEGFAGLEECKAWAESRADGFRREYFAFEFECRRDGRTFKRKLW